MTNVSGLYQVERLGFEPGSGYASVISCNVWFVSADFNCGNRWPRRHTKPRVLGVSFLLLSLGSIPLLGWLLIASQGWDYWVPVLHARGSYESRCLHAPGVGRNSSVCGYGECASPQGGRRSLSSARTLLLHPGASS